MAAFLQCAYGNTLRCLVWLVFIYMVTYALSLNVHGLFTRLGRFITCKFSYVTSFTKYVKRSTSPYRV